MVRSTNRSLGQEAASSSGGTCPVICGKATPHHICLAECTLALGHSGACRFQCDAFLRVPRWQTCPGPQCDHCVEEEEEHDNLQSRSDDDMSPEVDSQAEDLPPPWSDRYRRWEDKQREAHEADSCCGLVGNAVQENAIAPLLSTCSCPNTKVLIIIIYSFIF